jgi:hypothetical protein
MVVLLAMVWAWCPPCVAAIQAANSCCSQPCDDCACGFEAMPADLDPAPAVVIPSPLTLEPVFESNHSMGTSDIALRTSHNRTHRSDPAPPSTNARLSLLSVYLI